MRILVLAQYFPPDMGGASARVSNVVQGLLSSDCVVTVIASFPHYPHGEVPAKYRGKPVVLERASAARVIRVWIPSLPHSSAVNRIVLHTCFVLSSLFALPFVGGFDVIWAANPNLFCFYSALVYAFFKRKPIVRNVDDLWPEVFYELGLVRSRLVRGVLDFLAWLSYAVPTAITPVSPGYKQRIMEKYGIRPQKINVIEVGISSVEPLNTDRDSVKPFVVMYSGVLGLGYDFDVLLDAAGLLAENKDILFVIRGIGELAPKLRRQIRELGLGNVVLDNTFLSEEKLSALLDSADVFVLPMAFARIVDEGLPTKVFEYQAHEKPVICVSAGEPARYVRATKSGLVVKPGDVSGLVEAILRVHENKKFASELGRNGWEYVSTNLTAEKIGKRMYEVFASAIR